MSIQSKPVKKGSSYDLAIVKTEKTEKRVIAIVKTEKTEKRNEAIVKTQKIVKTEKIEKTEWKIRRKSDSFNARPISAGQLPSKLIKPASQPRKPNLNRPAVAPMPKANHSKSK
ncbi:hypothetical protein FCV25MIE_27097 [Fagus crenata]